MNKPKFHDIITSELERLNRPFSIDKHDSTVKYKLKICPICKQGTKDVPNNSCMLTLSPGKNNTPRINYRCYNDKNNIGMIDQDEALIALGINTNIFQDGNRKTSNNNAVEDRSTEHISQTVKPKNKLLPTHGKRLHKRLLNNSSALSVIQNTIGINKQCVSKYQMGLSEIYRSRKTSATQENVLTIPILTADGSFNSLRTCIAIPDFTKNPNADYWSPHKAKSFYSRAHEGRPNLVIYENIIDLFISDQFLSNQKHDKNQLLMCSSVPDEIPTEWNSDFFSKFHNIYCCQHTRTSRFCSEIAGISCQEIFNFELPNEHENWLHYFKSTSSINDFIRLMDSSSVIKPGLDKSSPKERSASIAGNLLPYDPIDCNGAFHNNYLYYSAQFIKIEEILDEVNNTVKNYESIETVLIRSDQTIQYVTQQALPSNSHQQNRVKRLTDGTLITRDPEASESNTWSHDSINQFINGESNPTSLPKLLNKINCHLSSTVFLPNQSDYILLTLVAAISYCMSIFDNVPLVLLTGTKGTGKSVLSKAIVDVSANAIMLGQGSPAAIARAVDSSRGLVVLDDMDQLGTGSKGGGNTEQLRQQLKQSYSKSSASKVVFDGIKGKTLNFFGIKVINNTTGIDPITGSRCLHIYTEKLPESKLKNFSELLKNHLNAEELQSLRDDLHTWVMMNISEINNYYLQIIKGKTSRIEEIYAPLRTFAKLSGDNKIIETLEKSLYRQTSILKSADAEPEELLTSIVKQIANDGYTHISPTHICMESQRLMGIFENQKNHCGSHISAEWVGKKLRSMKLVDTSTKAIRKTIRGHKLRFIGLSPELVSQSSQKKTARCIQLAEDFCKYRITSCCSNCRYASVGCILKS